MSANICSICRSKMVKTVREMLRNHRGLSELRRIKAVFWWCYMHTEAPLEPAEMLRSMPRNKDLQTLINEFRPQRRESIYPDTYGNAVVYSELQQAIPIPIQQNNPFTHFLSYSPCLILASRPFILLSS